MSYLILILPKMRLSHIYRPVMLENKNAKTPEGLPRPIDDGACNHLIGMKLPDINLIATDGSVVNLSKQERKTVVYCYPGVPLPEGWDEIPAHPRVVHLEITILSCLN